MIGSKITKIRPMYKGEYYREGWEKSPHNPVYVVELDNGCHLFSSRDYEGNDGGALFGYDGKSNKGFTITDNPAFVTPIKVDTSNMNNEEFGEYIKKSCKKN